MVVPVMYMTLKELTVKASMAYDDKDFKETVDAFVSGKTCPTPLISTTDACRQIQGRGENGHKSDLYRRHLHERFRRVGYEQGRTHQDHGYNAQRQTIAAFIYQQYSYRSYYYHHHDD